MTEKPSTLRLKIDGCPGEIDLKALEKSIQAVSKLIRAIGGADAMQNVEGLKTSSAIVDVTTETINAKTITVGLRSLSSRSHLPDGFTNSALKAIEDLHKVSKIDGVTGVCFGSLQHPIRIDHRVFVHAAEARKAFKQSLGSVKGTLYRFSASENKLQAGLVDEKSGHHVNLTLQQDHVKPVLDSMQAEVRVWGILTRDPPTNDVLEVKVKGVRKVAKKDCVREGAHTVQGILGHECLDGIDPAELVRRERGA
ncbi:hypothetical protein [Corynebacterium flavescens]|uniref:hypothetical protein n=1 Tax=Corynebacterium flavescens TaxID=28028 RepID=UPI002649A32F|nr:hypothetical protein [Corynebacterium flavescens]MDN6225648.1 hypothetical protein [Corynebacterium flavescens]